MNEHEGLLSLCDAVLNANSIGEALGGDLQAAQVLARALKELLSPARGDGDKSLLREAVTVRPRDAVDVGTPVVTRGGIPLADQQAGIEEFNRQALRVTPTPPSPSRFLGWPRSRARPFLRQ